VAIQFNFITTNQPIHGLVIHDQLLKEINALGARVEEISVAVKNPSSEKIKPLTFPQITFPQRNHCGECNRDIPAPEKSWGEYGQDLINSVSTNFPTAVSVLETNILPVVRNVSVVGAITFEGLGILLESTINPAPPMRTFAYAGYALATFLVTQTAITAIPATRAIIEQDQRTAEQNQRIARIEEIKDKTLILRYNKSNLSDELQLELDQIMKSILKIRMNNNLSIEVKDQIDEIELKIVNLLTGSPA